MNRDKKILMGILIWVLIPISIDLIYLFVLNSLLPKFWLLSEFTLISMGLNLLIWIVYCMMVRRYQKSA